jgi:hypothetical protein
MSRVRDPRTTTLSATPPDAGLAPPAEAQAEQISGGEADDNRPGSGGAAGIVAAARRFREK